MHLAPWNRRSRLCLQLYTLSKRSRTSYVLCTTLELIAGTVGSKYPQMEWNPSEQRERFQETWRYGGEGQCFRSWDYLATTIRHWHSLPEKGRKKSNHAQQGNWNVYGKDYNVFDCRRLDLVVEQMLSSPLHPLLWQLRITVREGTLQSHWFKDLILFKVILVFTITHHKEAAPVPTEADQSFTNGKTSTSQMKVRPGLRRKFMTWIKHKLLVCL